MPSAAADRLRAHGRPRSMGRDPQALEALAGSRARLEESAVVLLERDPLVARALEVLAAAPQSADEVAEHLLYEELLASSSFEVGTWGRAPFASAAERALRLQRVSVGGDEIDWGAMAEPGVPAC